METLYSNCKDLEKEALNELKEEINKPLEVQEDKFDTFILYNIESAKIILNLIKKQSKEIEEYKKQLDLDEVTIYGDMKSPFSDGGVE